VTEPLFRPEAVDYRAQEGAGRAPLRLAPAWTRWAFWLLAAIVVGAAAAAWFVRMHEYAVGPAIVRVDGRAEITAHSAATVAQVLVRPGEHVTAGQPLVQFTVDDEGAELERLRREFDLQLLKVLRDPQDQPARETLSSLRAQRDLASARLDQRLVRAPVSGIVSDVRIRVGQHLAVGELLLGVVREDAPLSLIALLPGRYRPMLKPGMLLRFELAGYRYHYRELPIDAVADEVIGPGEAKRFLGPDVADGIDLREPIVLVRATLPSRHFDCDGERYSYYDGLHANAQARVRSERVLVRAIPALRELVHDGP
jgi:membrane fusion protein (multidrug efflux system)